MLFPMLLSLFLSLLLLLLLFPGIVCCRLPEDDQEGVPDPDPFKFPNAGNEEDIIAIAFASYIFQILSLTAYCIVFYCIVFYCR